MTKKRKKKNLDPISVDDRKRSYEYSQLVDELLIACGVFLATAEHDDTAARRLALEVAQLVNDDLLDNTKWELGLHASFDEVEEAEQRLILRESYEDAIRTNPELQGGNFFFSAPAATSREQEIFYK